MANQGIQLKILGEAAGRQNALAASSASMNSAEKNTSAPEIKDEKNFLEGLGYLGWKAGHGFLSTIEGAWDYAAGGFAKLFGGDEGARWAEELMKEDWVDYTRPDSWFKPDERWKVAGDVASGIGTSLPAIATALGAAALTVATGGAAAPAAVGIAAKTISASGILLTGAGAAGGATKEAYQQTGELGGKEFGYGALVGTTEAAIEGITAGLGTGTGRVIKSLTNTASKQATKSMGVSLLKTLGADFASEATEEMIAEAMAPIYARATYDKNAETASFGEILYSGFVGGISGMLMGGTTSLVSGRVNAARGADAAAKGQTEQIISEAKKWAEFNSKNNTEDPTMEEIGKTVTELEESLASTGGEIRTDKQKRLLGKLKYDNALAELNPMFYKSAVNAIVNADVLAAQYAGGILTDENGNKINVTADDIRAGLDIEHLNARSIQKALKENPALRMLVVNDVTGHILMNTQNVTNDVLSGGSIASQADLNRLLETASAEEIRDLSAELGIDNWERLTPEDFNDKVAEWEARGGLESYKSKRSKLKTMKETARFSKTVPKAIFLGDGKAKRFKDDGIDLTVYREGDTYTLLDNDTDRLSRNLTREEVNEILRGYAASRTETSAETENKASTPAKTKYQQQAEEYDRLARENIPEYASLSAANKGMVRKTIRQAYANGMSDSDVLMLARVSAHSGIDIIISKEECRRKKRNEDGTIATTEDGRVVYEVLDGYYNIKTGKMYINPQATQKASDVVAHEAFHAIIAKLGKTKATERIFKVERDVVPADVKEKIQTVYSDQEDFVITEEIGAHATLYLNNEAFMTSLVTEKPSLKKTIIDFLKGAKTNYAKDGRLSRAANKYLKMYSKLFAEMSGINKQGQALEIKMPSARVADGKASIKDTRGASAYSYKALTSKPDIPIVELPTEVPMTEEGEVDKNSIFAEARKNAKKQNNSKNTPTSTYIYIDDIGIDVLLSKNGMKHGLARSEETALAVMKIGDILKSSVAVNELNGSESRKTDMSYVLIGACQDKDNLYVVRSVVSKLHNDVTEIDVYQLGAIKNKKTETPTSALGGAAVREHSSLISSESPTISISDFLQFVKDISIANEIFSEDVLKVLGVSRTKGSLSGDVRYSRLNSKTKVVHGYTLNKNAIVNTDLLEELRIYDPAAEVSADGAITVYHRTSKESAAAIRKTGIMKAEEDALFFSSKREGYASDYGDTVLTFKIPSTQLRINDIFDGEVHFDMPLKRLANGWSANVRAFLIDEVNPPDEISSKKSSGDPGIRASRPLSEAVGEIATSTIAEDLSSTKPPRPTVKEYAGEKIQEFATMSLSAQIQFINEQAGIEHAAVKMGVDRNKIESAVQMVRNSAAQAQYLMVGRQFNLFTDDARLMTTASSKSLTEIMNQIPEEDRDGFQMYLYHAHNVDRMSLEARSREKLNALIAERDAILARVRELDSRLATETDSVVARDLRTQRKEANKVYNRLKKEVEGFELAENKPVLAKTVDGVKVAITAEESAEMVRKYEAERPEFKTVADELYSFLDNVQRMRLDAGLITEDHYNTLKAMYPHYVPTYRVEDTVGISGVWGKHNLEVKKTVGKAKGSLDDLARIDVSIANQLMQTVRAANVNRLAGILYDAATAGRGDTRFVEEVRREKVDTTSEEIDHSKDLPKNNQISFYKDGERITLAVTPEIFTGFDAFNSQATTANSILKLAESANTGFKRLVTSANPFFLIKNAFRDLQDAGINTVYARNPITFLKNYKEAAIQIATNGEYWQKYCALGGVNSSVFDHVRGVTKQLNAMGLTKAEGNILNKTVTIMENANVFIEQLPRLMEFISAIEAGATPQTAILASADVTTNFARSGKIGKVLNRTIIPFLNPAIQGMSKIFRNVKGAFLAGSAEDVAREFAILALKAAFWGIIPMVLNNMLYEDDEDYKNLRDNDKENNYLLKVGDVFWKIPRGRVAAVLAGLYNRTASQINGNRVDWMEYFDNVLQNVTPVQNFSRTIFSPFTDIATNRTWYGTEIDGQEWDNTRPRNRYDESTSDIAIAIGSILPDSWDVSPKKIHYLLDQYSGIIGDLVLPLTTEKAEGNIIEATFTVDPVTSNRLSSDFYALLEDVRYRNTEGDETAKYQLKYLNSVKKDISKMFDERQAVQQNSDLSDKDKLAQVRIIQALINKAYETAVADFEEYTKAVESTHGYYDEDTQERERYAEITRRTFGAEKALEQYNRDVYEKASALNKAGLAYDDYYVYYFGTKGIQSDKDKNGNTISGSKKKKVLQVIDTLKVSTEQKLMILAANGYNLGNNDIKGVSKEAAYGKLLKYILNSKNLTKAEKEALAKMCGFTVRNGKIIRK